MSLRCAHVVHCFTLVSTPIPARKPSVASPPAKAVWKQAALGLAALLAIATAAHFLVQGQKSSLVPKTDGQLYEATGQALAEETARLLANKGKIVILTARSGAQPSPVHAGYLNGFKAALKPHRGLTLLATESIDPTEAGCPADAFMGTLQRHPTADAVVSFIGPPVLKSADFNTLPARRPKLVVLGGDRSQTRTLMSRKILDASFVPRMATKSSTPTAPQTAREQFDQFFQHITPATVANWTEGAKP